MTRTLYLLAALLISPLVTAAPGLPEALDVDESLPTPAAVLGFEPGERHPRHDQIVAYLQALAESSDRVMLEEIGRSHGQRPQILLTFASPERLADIEAFRAGRRAAARRGEGPPVVWLGYSVHGNEASGASAALVMAWYLAAGRDERVGRWLDEMVIVMEPAINPDGIDRFAHWVNMHRGNHPSTDAADREHAEGWPNGRTNYYWFDLNRDWLPVVHPLSQNRLRHLQRWRPHVVTDHHEMGHNSSYFFQPGIPERSNPLISQANQDLTAVIAEFHSRALDAAGQPFYTRESFDDFYIGKGSTYPDVTGGIGILFEQGSSRGVVQDSVWGPRRFSETVANQVRTSVSTLDGALAHAEELLAYQRDFFADVRERAGDSGRAGWLLGDAGDPARAHAFIGMLLNHDITVHPVTEAVEIEGRSHGPGSAWAIPAHQDAWLLIKSMFEAETEVGIETFYDVSAWPMAMAHDLPLATVRRLPSIGEALLERPVHRPAAVETGALAWVVPWNQYRADALLAALLDDGYRVQALSKPLTARVPAGNKAFGRGSLVIHSGIQPENLDPVAARLDELSRRHGVDVIAVGRGLAVDGVDLGSPSVPVLEPLSAALLTGHGVSAYAAGAVWHWFDTRLARPVTQLDAVRLHPADLEGHTHLIVPPGRYGSLGDSARSAIAGFVDNGGTLIAFGSAAEMVESLELDWNLVDQDEQENPSVPERRAYGDYRQDHARELIGGAALLVDIDPTHPLAWGYADEELVLFRQGAHRLRAVDNAYAQVGVYADDPLAAGYLSQARREKLAGTPAVSASRHGAGTVVRIADEPLFRGYWRGGEKLFANALFFSQLVSPTRLPE